MRIFCLGGAGRICREAILDLVQFSQATRITVADLNEAEGRAVVAWLNDPRVDFVKVDVRDRSDTVPKMRGYDVVMDAWRLPAHGVLGLHHRDHHLRIRSQAARPGGVRGGPICAGAALCPSARHCVAATLRHRAGIHHSPRRNQDAGLEYTRNVGIPLAIGAVLLAEGRANKTGILTPEEAFEPPVVFDALKQRQMFIHEEITAL